MKRSFLNFQKFEENKLSKNEQKTIRGGGDSTQQDDYAVKTQTKGSTETIQKQDEGGVVPIKGVGSI